MRQIVAAAHAIEHTAQKIAALADEDPSDEDGRSAALALIARVLPLTEQAETLTARAISVARDRGCTWQDIGNVLGTTRQAAFQRYGRSVDPRTGASLSHTPGSDAERRALGVLTALTEGQWSRVSESFNDAMSHGLPDTTLAENWASVIAQFGLVESVQPPAVWQQGLHTVVDVPVAYDAGDVVVRITYDADARIAGLYFLYADVPSADHDGR